MTVLEDRIEITINEGVADVRLVRSDKMNALDDRMFTALAAAGEQLANSPEVRVVVLSGEGKAFCAGLDMATACDIRLCSRDAIFSLREAAVGFVADVGVLQRLPLIVGQGIARELAFKGCEIFIGSTAWMDPYGRPPLDWWQTCCRSRSIETWPMAYTPALDAPLPSLTPFPAPGGAPLWTSKAGFWRKPPLPAIR